MLQLLVSDGQMMGGLSLMKGIDREESNQQHQGDTCVDKPLVGETLFLLGNLSLLLMGVVHRSQFCRIVLLGLIDGAVERLTDLHSHGDGRVFALGPNVGTIFGQQILLDIVERQGDTVLTEQMVEVAEIVSSLIVSVGGQQIVVGIKTPLTRLAIMRINGGFEVTRSLLGLSHVLQGHSTHQVDLCLRVTDNLGFSDRHMLIVSEQFLGTVDPGKCLFIVFHAKIFVGNAAYGLIGLLTFAPRGV